MPTEATKRALIIKVGAIGDAVMALPLVRELSKRGFSEVTWVGGRDIASILGLAPEISERVIIDERALFGGSKLKAVVEVLRTWWRMRALRVDNVYLLHADSRYKLLVPPWLRSKVSQVRVGSRRHHTFDYARLAHPDREDNSLAFDPYTLPQASSRVERICVFPGGAKNALRDNPLRRWPLDHYVKLCGQLLESGYRVSIIGGPSDQWIAPSFESLRPRLEWQVGTMKLNETVDYLRHSRFAVSHDTGPVHLASLANCPIVTIFGPTNSEWFAPINFKHLVVERAEKLPCQPCYDGKEFGQCSRNICISEISPDIVFEKIQSALR